MVLSWLANCDIYFPFMFIFSSGYPDLALMPLMLTSLKERDDRFFCPCSNMDRTELSSLTSALSLLTRLLLAWRSDALRSDSCLGASFSTFDLRGTTASDFEVPS